MHQEPTTPRLFLSALICQIKCCNCLWTSQTCHTSVCLLRAAVFSRADAPGCIWIGRRNIDQEIYNSDCLWVCSIILKSHPVKFSRHMRWWQPVCQNKLLALRFCFFCFLETMFMFNLFISYTSCQHFYNTYRIMHSLHAHLYAPTLMSGGRRDGGRARDHCSKWYFNIHKHKTAGYFWHVVRTFSSHWQQIWTLLMRHSTISKNQVHQNTIFH